MSTKTLKFYAVDASGNIGAVSTENYQLEPVTTLIANARMFLSRYIDHRLLLRSLDGYNPFVFSSSHLGYSAYVGPSMGVGYSNLYVTAPLSASFNFYLQDPKGVAMSMGSVGFNQLNNYFEPQPVSSAPPVTSIQLINDYRMSLNSLYGWVDVWHLEVNGSPDISAYHIDVYNGINPNSAPLNQPRTLDNNPSFDTYYASTPGTTFVGVTVYDKVSLRQLYQTVLVG